MVQGTPFGECLRSPHSALRPVRTRDAGFHRIMLSLQSNCHYFLPISQCYALTILKEDDHRYICQRCCEELLRTAFVSNTEFWTRKASFV
jgi:hypothetical protein